MTMNLNGLKVLVVEDQYLLADELSRVLQECRAEVVGPAPTRELALRLVDERQIDLALLDINLGRGNVYNVAEALRTRGLPIIFVTGYARHDIREDFRDSPYIEKPFSAAQLIAEIRRLDPGLTGAMTH